MGQHDEPGRGLVTDITRRFELEDQQVFPGAGRGPTAAEAAAAERAGPVSERTRRAYRDMILRGKSQQGEGRIDP
jgi:hypothetical protein